MRVEWEDCVLRGLEWGDCRLMRVEWEDCVLRGLEWEECRLMRVEWEKCRLMRVEWEDCVLRGLEWEECRLMRLEWEDVRLKTLELENCSAARNNKFRTMSVPQKLSRGRLPRIPCPIGLIFRSCLLNPYSPTEARRREVLGHRLRSSGWKISAQSTCLHLIRPNDPTSLLLLSSIQSTESASIEGLLAFGCIFSDDELRPTRCLEDTQYNPCTVCRAEKIVNPIQEALKATMGKRKFVWRNRSWHVECFTCVWYVPLNRSDNAEYKYFKDTSLTAANPDKWKPKKNDTGVRVTLCGMPIQSRVIPPKAGHEAHDEHNANVLPAEMPGQMIAIDGDGNAFPIMLEPQYANMLPA
ncbi:unnamed protein product [Cyprideis torosa]|uniref:Uncharacterized protein n=1 Tax=Cyprideis torosa TaxID=163714 RepID=A0A7R8WKW6_9CRUS|nr:unnamed protein product [Cyprideis torosa]CAG0901826.1 unnamed protein product [Cyprideis torosa]